MRRSELHFETRPPFDSTQSPSTTEQFLHFKAHDCKHNYAIHSHIDFYPQMRPVEYLKKETRWCTLFSYMISVVSSPAPGRVLRGTHEFMYKYIYMYITLRYAVTSHWGASWIVRRTWTPLGVHARGLSGVAGVSFVMFVSTQKWETTLYNNHYCADSHVWYIIRKVMTYRSRRGPLGEN